MSKQRITQTIIIVVLVVSVFTMSLGFALGAFNSTLEIIGNTTVKQAKWEVLFNTGYGTNGAVVTKSRTELADPTTLSVTGTSATFAITLPQPGDYYELEFEVQNTGTLDAQLSSYSVTPTTSSPTGAKIEDYTNIVVTYDGAAVTTPTQLKAGETGNTAKVKVRIEYKIPTDPANLPTEADVVGTFTIALNYQSLL